MTTNRHHHHTLRQHRTEPTPSSIPSEAAIIQILHTAIDDLQLLQQAIKGVLEQEGHGDEDRQRLEQTLRDAQHAEWQACEDLKALLQKPEN
jgi:hypothetical protein